MILTQKETMLLEDLKSEESLCIQKYDEYAKKACDSELKTLFSEIGNVEREHFGTLQQIQNGTVPPQSLNAAKAEPAASQQNMPTYSDTANSEERVRDTYLCTDALSSEKHASSLYDTCIFEFRDTAVRQILNHIQKEEQEHGEKIYSYMARNGMYH